MSVKTVIIQVLLTNFAAMYVVLPEAHAAVGLWVLTCLGYIVALPIACHVCQENVPSWPGSVGIMIGVACVGGVCSLIVYVPLFLLFFLFSESAAFVVDFVVGIVIIWLLEMLIAGMVYAGMLPGVTFGKGLLLYLVQCVLVVAMAMVLFVGFWAVRGVL